MKFTNKIALVTGGATGVGRAVCMDLARQGATVVLNYGHSNSAAWENVGMIQSCGGKVVAMKADVSDDGAVKEMIRNVEKEFGALHYLVNNAGLTKSLARALAPEIRVNCIAPAAILTPRWQGKEDKMHRLNGNLPLERYPHLRISPV